MQIPVVVDGPYGMNHGLTTDKYEAAAFIAGGVGVSEGNFPIACFFYNWLEFSCFKARKLQVKTRKLN